MFSVETDLGFVVEECDTREEALGEAEEWFADYVRDFQSPKVGKTYEMECTVIAYDNGNEIMRDKDVLFYQHQQSDLEEHGTL